MNHISLYKSRPSGTPFGTLASQASKILTFETHQSLQIPSQWHSHRHPGLTGDRNTNCWATPISTNPDPAVLPLALWPHRLQIYYLLGHTNLYRSCPSETPFGTLASQATEILTFEPHQFLQFPSQRYSLWHSGLTGYRNTNLRTTPVPTNPLPAALPLALWLHVRPAY